MARFDSGKKMYFDLIRSIDKGIKEYGVAYQDAAVIVMRAEDYLTHKECYEMGYGPNFDRNNIIKREYKPYGDLEEKESNSQISLFDLQEG